MINKISWWNTVVGEQEIQRVVDSLNNRCISQGKVTRQFENELASFLEVENVIAVSSGSVALLMALMAVGVKPGDEVILPNRTWIATAHAVKLINGKVVVVDVEDQRPIIDADKIESCITQRTKAIIPVHMNGRAADMEKINEIGKRYSIFIIEDAAQAIASRNKNGYLGTQSDIGCFSLSVTKTITTGQGGFVVTNNNDLAARLRAIRTHGVENVKNPRDWTMMGFNFRLTDIQSSIGIEQLRRLPDKLEHIKDIYRLYAESIRNPSFQLIPVRIDEGEIPVYNEFLVDNRSEWIQQLEKMGIESRPFYPEIDKAAYLEITRNNYQNSTKYGLQGIYLPSGPDQSVENVKKVIQVIESLHS